MSLFIKHIHFIQANTDIKSAFNKYISELKILLRKILIKDILNNIISLNFDMVDRLTVRAKSYNLLTR